MGQRLDVNAIRLVICNKRLKERNLNRRTDHRHKFKTDANI